jgi:hypothetical protein
MFLFYSHFISPFPLHHVDASGHSCRIKERYPCLFPANITFKKRLTRRIHCMCVCVYVQKRLKKIVHMIMKKRRQVTVASTYTQKAKKKKTHIQIKWRNQTANTCGAWTVRSAGSLATHLHSARAHIIPSSKERERQQERTTAKKKKQQTRQKKRIEYETREGNKHAMAGENQKKEKKKTTRKKQRRWSKLWKEKDIKRPGIPPHRCGAPRSLHDVRELTFALALLGE